MLYKLSYQKKVSPEIFSKFLRDVQSIENKVFIPGALVMWCWGLSIAITYNRVIEEQTYRIYRIDEDFILPITAREAKIIGVSVLQEENMNVEVIKCTVTYFDVKVEICIDTLIYKPDPDEARGIIKKLIEYGLVPYSLLER